VSQPTKYQFIINLKTTNAVGLTPVNLLACVDQGYCVATFRPSLDVQKSHAPIPGDRLSCIGRFGNQRLLGETPIDDQMASRRGRSCRAKSACEPEDRSRS